jgi:chemotaxis protein MotB
MARRHKKGHAHADERWLLTYADMITLLFALFIILFSISVVNTSKFELLKRTLADAFSAGVLDNGSAVLPETKADTVAPITESPPNIVDAISPPTSVTLVNSQASPQQALETQQLEEVKRKIEKEAAQAGFKGKITATVNERGLAIRILTDGVLFDSGSFVLRPEGKRLLAPIGASIKNLPNTVRIEGHTDSDPIHNGILRNNRWLGATRALAVTDYLVEGHGVPEERIRPMSFGDTRAVAPNDTAEHKQQNRRVEMLVLREQGAPQQTPATVLGG